MSSQGFSFPPPPPPPPTTHQPSANPPVRHGQYSGGRGVDQRGRGRGQGNRGRGGGHQNRTGRAPSYSAPGPLVAQPNYGGYIPQALPTAPYMPPSPYHHSQPSVYQNPQAPSSFQPQQYGQSVPPQGHLHNQHSQHPHPFPYPYTQPGTTGHPQHMPTNTPPAQYTQGLQAPHQSSNHAVMGGAPWHPGMHGAGSYMGPQMGKARAPRPPHNNHNSNSQPHKRNHSSAFSKPQTTAPRTPAAPAVPSFGNPLPSKPPLPADAAAASKAKRKRRKHNQLGLTPHANDQESSEDEGAEDEESKLAQSVSEKAPLEVSYKGKTSKLESASDIAAWIAERKKRFPTQARIEEKKKVMEEASKARAAVRQEKNKEQQKKRKDHGQKQNEPIASSAAEPVTDAQRRETIQRDLEREEQRILKAMAETEAARLRLEALKKEKEALSLSAGSDQKNATAQDTQVKHNDSALESATEPKREDSTPGAVMEAEPQEPLPDIQPEREEPGPVIKPEPHVPDTLPDTSNPENQIEPEHTVKPEVPSYNELDVAMDLASNHGSDWTSSSGSGSDSDSDSDDAPEQATSRRTGPERVPPPPREGKRMVCRYFARNGLCNRGDQCKFLHDNETSDRNPKAKAKPTEKKDKDTKRKGLYQALLDQQKEEDNQRAMEVISWLGQNNMLMPASDEGPAPHDTPN
ncbi:uncharacterized protein N7515_009934 [Penicillium bovifimosum]|uniref:C3H1-type domain-containing protein n=1 Tax=Penicillium bovifimosum TaxID=126998 RepID=A0A9W9KTP8_9EURO|nr:uncharacterized protein N7515_009934 [Penicillium bovifimosum]KAJ5120546.1 hypothetical protein N7515_009934 [Penicillium bovifimosum]